MNKNRVIILMIDSLGIGSSKDAYKFNDVGSDTFGHIYEHIHLANRREVKLKIPNLEKKGLLKAAEKSRKSKLYGNNDSKIRIDGAYGYAIEKSSGKDTISGHWEIVGCPFLSDFYYFKSKNNKSCFPKEFIDCFIKEANLKNGIIDGGHASGTEIINKFGKRHIKTKQPIIYTSADSVFQIAAHEKFFSIKDLYRISNIARKILDKMNINVARVISRPFVNGKKNNYERTKNRKDYSVPPPRKTLLNKLSESKGHVISIGKIADIFSNQGITKSIKADGISDLFDKTIFETFTAPPGSIIFTNFVDFDSKCGHRRDVNSYAKSLEYFDSRLPELNRIVKKSDMVVLCADHGCDPTWYGNDHTREHIPFLFWGDNIKPGFIGARKSFSDIGATIAKFLGLHPLKYGKSCLQLNREI